MERYKQFFDCAKQLGSLFLYDRNGLGKSSPDFSLSPNHPLTAASVSDQLQDLLKKLGLPSPYVFVANSYSATVDDLYKTYGASHAETRTGNVNVTKSSSYTINIDDDVKFNNISYRILSSDYRYLNITPGPDEYGHYHHFVGQVFHLESKDKTNSSFMGDCNLTITDSKVR